MIPQSMSPRQLRSGDEEPWKVMVADHVPGCRAWIDRRFEDRVAINYAHAGRIQWAMGKGELRELRAPVLWWTWPGPLFRYGARDGESEGWDHYYVTMCGPWVDWALKTGWIDMRTRTPYARVSDAGRCREEFDALVGEARRREGLQAVSRVLALFRIAREGRDAAERQEPQVRLLKEIMGAIRKEPDREWAEEKEARRLGVSAAHFRRLFRVAAGLPFRSFCLRARMDLAGSLLRGGDLPIKEVAARCGAPDVYHFHRLFKKFCADTPARYRAATRLRL